MSVTHIVTAGPLTANAATTTSLPRGARDLTPGNAIPAGTGLAATGRTSQDGVWVEAKTPFQVRTPSAGASWFHRDYIRPASRVRSGVAGVLDRWVADVEGKRLDVDGRHGAQCVDAAKDWARAVTGRDPARAAGDGKDVAATLVSEGWARVAPAQIQAGDVVSLGAPFGVSRDKRTGAETVYGHVAVALGPAVNGRVPVMQQDGFDKTTVAYRGTLPVSAVVAVARPPKAAAPATQDQKRRHTIAAGDTLWGLTRRYGVSLGALMELNPRIQADNLRVGQTLVVAR